ncbi:zinc-dependent alcohol dehydrogenase [Alkalicoccus halolimnae]|uniref:Alcohol dehydrogenase catalytic domain-containing protein n=1 Tax=Alkalicoccus halolimnae TaxID=1667239 RepID=A0A5C7F4A4_9BACI|nr:alcohol dehydrogenase catalytic domain-containing protein [Alkalicoccus halolimnae]TXF83323.1 zinc-binding dehydrogenase [Alkalicoccus halolimnae]
MKSGVYQGEGHVVVDESPVPLKNDNEALIKVSFAGICGTDMMIYSGLHPRATAPLIMGHEFSGIVEEIGTFSLKPGDQVAINPLNSCGHCYACQIGQRHICANLKYLGIDINGGFAEYVSVPYQNLHKLPENVTTQEGALTEPLAVAVHTIRKSTLKFGDTAAILGAGPIGILIGILAKKAGASKVIISDVNPYRLNVAASYGLAAIDANEKSISDVTKQVTNGVGADVVFEAAGNQMTANQMIDAIKPQGEILLVSVYKKSPTIDLAKMHFREISLKTTRCFTTEEFQIAIDLMKRKEVDLTGLISHNLPIEEFPKGFQLMQHSTEALKILYQL